jgi:hypothetical protein
MYAPARPDLPPLSMPSKNASGDLGQERISVAQFFLKKVASMVEATVTRIQKMPGVPKF